jgi:predicted GIY-YIG superfamily endonuclease
MSAKIYKIVNDLNDEIYIGSTKQQLSKRFYEHKSDSRNEKTKHYKLYQLVEEYGWDSFRIILIEEFKCENREEQRKKEQQYIDELKPSLNKLRAFGTKCGHNKRSSCCVICGGGEICEHKRMRNRCKECGGSQICEHNRVRSHCKDCGGSQICEHNRIKGNCRECNGSRICEHNRIKYSCKECGGSRICEHDNVKSRCKSCKGGSICVHNKRKSMCKECSPVVCEICYATFSKDSYGLHLKSRKHQKNLNQS